MTTHVAEETSRVRKFQLSTNQEEQTKNHQAAGILLQRPLDRCQGRTEEFLMEGRGPNFVSENITETFITEKRNSVTEWSVRNPPSTSPVDITFNRPLS